MRECGGCEWLGLPYRKQLARKQRNMEALFGNMLEPGALQHIVPMTGTADSPKSPRAFRHKAATPFSPGPHGSICCGFFARGTHDIVPCPECAVEAPGARRILNEVAQFAEQLNIPAYDEDRGKGLLRHAVVRMGWRTNDAMLTIVTRERCVPRLHELADALLSAHPSLVAIAQNINPRAGNAILGGETRILTGSAHMRDQLLGCTFEISPTSFYQTNPAQTEALYRLAIDGMHLSEGDVLLDAYCGSGTIGLCAADAARTAGSTIHLLGVERNPEGVRDARRNAELNGLGNAATFVAQDATAYMRKAAASGLRVDVLSIDPPRAGSTPEFLDAAVAMDPRRIIYISCNPATQARDLNRLTHEGYRVLKLTPVDMFPHTAHVETVAVLAKSR